jgi:SPP1 gp7 family putative phage head morphogenesis protein
MTSDEYWQKRAEERENKWFSKSQSTIEKELAQYYRESLGKIQTDIAALYGRFAKDNKLSIEEARQLIQGQEYRQWRMDIETYVEKIKKTNSPGLLRELNTLAMRSRITRLDKLYSETLKELDNVGRKVGTGMDSFLTDAYKDCYYRNLYDVSTRLHSQLPVSKVSEKEMEKVLRTPWSGKNYSKRIWSNTGKLAEEIQDRVVTAVHQGTSVQQLSTEISDRMSVAQSNSTRLVRTELNYVENKAELDSVKSSGLEYVQFIATLDFHTSQICRQHDHKIFLVSEAKQGENVPPLHPNCRSTIAAVIGPDGNNGKRWARNGKSNQSTRVSGNMNYQQWYNKFVEEAK